MTLRDYVNERLDQGDGQTAVIEGLQRTMQCALTDAINNVPKEDWEAEIKQRQKESDGQILIWLENQDEPSYSIQE